MQKACCIATTPSMHKSSPLYLRGSANGGQSNYSMPLVYVNLYTDSLVAENIWTSTKGPTSAKNPNATICAASPILAVCSAINEKCIANTVGPKHHACARTPILNATLA